jgi:hypothetical protein
MRKLLVGAALLALIAPAAHAQQSGGQENIANPSQVEPGQYLVFFAFDEATLTAEARQVISEAAAEYQRTGAARVTVTGHTDTAGPAAYNLELSQRRAEAVANELIRQGVPAGSITTVGRGEEDLLVPTADGVREARNRRVVIEFPVPPAPAPAVAEAPAEPPPAEESPLKRFTFTLGGLYGHNFGEKDRGGDKTENDLAGAELTFDAIPGRALGLSFKQAILYSFNGVDDGLTGRSVLSLGLTPLNLVVFRPYLSANFGGVYGEGVQDGLVVGPELGFGIGITDTVTLNAKVAYDYQFRNAGWDEGIAWGGLGLGWRF